MDRSNTGGEKAHRLPEPLRRSEDDVEDLRCVGVRVAAEDGVVGDRLVRRGRPGEGDRIVYRRGLEVRGLGREVGACGGRGGGHLLVLGLDNPGDERQGGAEGRQPNEQQWERRKTPGGGHDLPPASRVRKIGGDICVGSP